MIPSSVADTVVLPAAMVVARPLDPLALLMVATAGAELLHVTLSVRFCVLLSLYVPVAVNCCVLFAAKVVAAGAIASDTSIAGVTVNVVAAELMPLTPAVTSVVPGVEVLAKPLDPAALLIVATVAVVLVHAAIADRFCVLPSL